ncbi:MAG TPA: hypothetical protein VMX55_06715 [candidate division Zixibacteria bacterium]|nr:hypothetical protein [candidate division Zixibacteria bacterium]
MFGFGLNSKKWVKESQKTEKETKKNTGFSFNTWKNIATTFNQDLENFNEMHSSDIPELDNTLIYFEMISFPKKLTLVQNLALWGYYHSALQELRFLLETTILAYYLDQQLPKTDYSSKIKLMQKHKGELWGVRLRRRAYMKEREFGEEVEKVIEEVNYSIDQYMQDNKIDSWRLKHLPYIEEEFNECVRHTRNVCALVMRHFTKCFSDFTYSGEMIITMIKEEQIETKQI